MTSLKLLGSTGSPFVRKVRVLLAENDLPHQWIEVARPGPQLVDGRIELAWRMEEHPLLSRHPLGKIPVLVSDADDWFDSRVICEFIEGSCTRPTEHAIADAACDAVANHKGLQRRNPNDALREEGSLRSWLARLLDGLESAGLTSTGTVLRSEVVAVTVMLAYLDFRLPEFAWRLGRPQLAALHSEVELRSSMLATRFPTEVM